jgi:hypothetical protein
MRFHPMIWQKRQKVAWAMMLPLPRISLLWIQSIDFSLSKRHLQKIVAMDNKWILFEALIRILQTFI